MIAAARNALLSKASHVAEQGRVYVMAHAFVILALWEILVKPSVLRIFVVYVMAMAHR